MKILIAIFILLPFCSIAQTNPCGNSITIKKLSLESQSHNELENLIKLCLGNFEIGLSTKDPDNLFSQTTHSTKNTFITHYNIAQISLFELKNVSENPKIPNIEESPITDLYYDSLGQLVLETGKGSPTPAYSKKYYYNKSGFLINIETEFKPERSCCQSTGSYSVIAANKIAKQWQSGTDASCMGWQRLEQIEFYSAGNYYKKGKKTKRKYANYLGKMLFSYSSEGLLLELKKLDEKDALLYHYKIKYKYAILAADEVDEK